MKGIEKMKNPRQKKMFAMFGSVLLGLTTELVVVGYYWGNLSGWWRVLTLGLFFVAYVQLWASWWYVDEAEDFRVIQTSFFVSLGLALVMAFNAGMILITRTNERKVEQARVAAAATEQAARETAAKLAAEEVDQKNRAKIAQIQAEADALAATKDWRTAREARLERESLAKAAAEAKRRQELQDAAAPKPVAAAVAPPAVQTDDFKDFIDFANWYCKVLVFLMPILAGIIGKFALGYAISLPGGASGYAPKPQAVPSSAPIGAPNPTGPRPEPMPFRPPGAPVAPIRERIPINRDGVGGIKN